MTDLLFDSVLDLSFVFRLERENTGLRERLLDLASMLDKIKLVDYMEKNDVSSIVLEV